jgi:hypothetical protein
MAAIIRKTESEERKAALYQEAERLLNDVISKSEEHFGLTAMRWICSDEYSEPTTAYCPAEPATSSMDIALRAAGIYAAWAK